MSKGLELPNEHHVSRYCRPGTVQNGMPLVGAFKLKDTEEHLSVNWLEYFELDTKDANLSKARQALIEKEYTIRKGGRFAVLNVGLARNTVLSGAKKPIRIMHWPKDDDPSHSGIFDYAAVDLQVALDLRSMVTPNDVYPVLP